MEEQILRICLMNRETPQMIKAFKNRNPQDSHIYFPFPISHSPLITGLRGDSRSPVNDGGFDYLAVSTSMPCSAKNLAAPG